MTEASRTICSTLIQGTRLTLAENEVCTLSKATRPALRPPYQEVKKKVYLNIRFGLTYLANIHLRALISALVRGRGSCQGGILRNTQPSLVLVDPVANLLHRQSHGAGGAFNGVFGADV